MPIEAILSNPEAHPLVLEEALVKTLLTEWIVTPLEVLIQYLQNKYDIEIPRVNIDKIGALKVLHNTDLFWDHWHIFEKVGNAFNNKIVQFNLLQLLSPPALAHTIKTANAIRKEEYDAEIGAYAYFCCMHYGCLYPGDDVLKIIPKNLISRFEKDIERIKIEAKKVKMPADLSQIKDLFLREQVREYKAIEAYLQAMDNMAKEQRNALVG